MFLVSGVEDKVTQLKRLEEARDLWSPVSNPAFKCSLEGNGGDKNASGFFHRKTNIVNFQLPTHSGLPISLWDKKNFHYFL